MLKINNIKIYEDLTENDLLKKIIKKYCIKSDDIIDWHITKKSIDARKKADIHYNYSVEIEVKNEEKYPKIDKENTPKDFKSLKNISQDNLNLCKKSVVVGAGPAGLFAALTFIKNNIKPIIIEQGKTVEERQQDVDNFMNNRVLNTFSNIKFP